ncbi:unnamed protein product [Rotaria socialis]|uniref:NAD(P)(+)--arginine ADP-ribosyltransferase n=1 Tax=Rotaria socialis TaxID=392032 RepID=A0A817T6Z7_9BILA|nr:unnamed protein product [Rotaria socialis]CAF4517423.1 unnamed protein product [Rotaria socialis]
MERRQKQSSNYTLAAAAAAATSISEKSTTRLKPPALAHDFVIQNFLLVWLDRHINDVKNADYLNTISKLKELADKVYKFHDADDFVSFISDNKREKICIITSAEMGEIIVPVIHNMKQISAIYILSGDQAQHHVWIDGWSKIKGIFTDIESICKALQQALQNLDQNSVTISFVSPSSDISKQNLDHLDSSFIYTQILKEIILSIDFDQQHIDEFILYCRQLFAENPIELKNVNKLAHEYKEHLPIWWYTYHCFLYSMLNRALRTMQVNLIIGMGFFIQGLHNHIVALHQEQFIEHSQTKLLTVFRGQSLCQKDFDRLVQTQYGLISFNNFISTSTNRDVSLKFVRNIIETTDLMGIIFVIKIDTSISSTPFANIREISYFKREEEILFSMHSIFRIGDVKQLDKDRLWQVDLTLTNDDDRERNALIEQLRKETYPRKKGWNRLGMLLIKLGKFNKAEEVYDILIDQAITNQEKAHIYHQLGWTTDAQGKYADAIAFYTQAIEIKQVIFSPNDAGLAASYTGIGLAYDKMDDYLNALSSHQKAIEIYEQSSPSNNPHLATSYDNIGVVYSKIGDHSNALLFHQKALKIRQKILPNNHPDFADSYNNIGLLYDNMGDYASALTFHRKALEIYQKTLPSDHPNLGTSHNNIGLVYFKMNDHPNALSFYERALDIQLCSLSKNHPNIRSLRKNIELIKKKI